MATGAFKNRFWPKRNGFDLDMQNKLNQEKQFLGIAVEKSVTSHPDIENPGSRNDYPSMQSRSTK
jgi:hypothetical protein